MLYISNILKDFLPRIEAVLKKNKSLTEQLNLNVLCCTLDTKIEMYEHIRSIVMSDEGQTQYLMRLLQQTTTSFSWGSSDIEVVALVFDDTETVLQLSNVALEGLFLHELMHSIQRQRGFEDDLKRSMSFSLDFFTQIAALVPAFPQGEIINFLHSISGIAVQVLKDLYVQTELIKRGKIRELMEYEELSLGLLLVDEPQIPKFAIPYEKGKTVLTNLQELEQAINFTMSLLPSWLPFSRLNKLESEELFFRGQNIARKIFSTYYTALPGHMFEFMLFEDLYLTSFAFNSQFHRQFFGAFFNLILQLILGEDFNFYHLSKVSELLYEIYDGRPQDIYDPLSLVLKASSVLFEEGSGIQKENITLLQQQISAIVSKEELDEFNDFITNEEDFEVAHLLESAFFHVLVDLRHYILDGKDTLLQKYCRTLLLLLYVAGKLDEKNKEQYLALKEQIYRILQYKYRTFYRILYVCKAEQLAKVLFFQQEDLSPSETKELMFNLRFFEVVIVSNDIFNLAVKFGQIVASVATKFEITDPNFVTTVALLCGSIAAADIKNEETLSQALSVLRATLLAKGYTFKIVRQITQVYGDLIAEAQDDDVKAQGEDVKAQDDDVKAQGEDVKAQDSKKNDDSSSATTNVESKSTAKTPKRKKSR